MNNRLVVSKSSGGDCSGREVGGALRGPWDTTGHCGYRNVLYHCQHPGDDIYYSFTRCFHWRILVKGIVVLFLKTVCASIVMSK